MTEAEQIVAFLQQNRPKRYCDDCIADELKLKRRQRSQRVTIALALTSDYQRQPGTCFVCRNDRKKLVIHAALAKV